MDKLMQEIWIQFLTEKQELPKNPEIELITFFSNYMNNLDDFHAVEDKAEKYVDFFSTEAPMLTLLRIHLTEETEETYFFRVLDPMNIRKEKNEDQIKCMANLVTHILNATTEYKIQAEQMKFEEAPGNSIEIPLSETDVRLSREEVEIFTTVLKRIALAKRINWEVIENKSFDIFLRGWLPEGKGKLNEGINNEEEPDFDWI